MIKSDFKEVFEQFLSGNQAFVFYRLPMSNRVHCYYQNDAELNRTTDLKTKGFVMSTFDKPLPAALIPDHNHLQFEYETEDFEPASIAVFSDSESKKTFINIVNRTKNAIESGRLKKLVVARNILSKKPVDVLQMFTHLLRLYPNAMVYFWHHPKAETWVGATPEKLFSFHSGQLTTMALAGTLSHNEEEQYQWGEKEKKEQAWVRETLYRNLIYLFPSAHVKCSETFTRRAGNLVHLCNELTVQTLKVNLAELVKRLHPTPAVGGIPVEEGLQFLAEYENLDRAYYAGFLGPIKGDDQIDLFVNLRCGQIIPKGLLLYVGAGITSDSNPEKEWDETHNKAKTLLAAL